MPTGAVIGNFSVDLGHRSLPSRSSEIGRFLHAYSHMPPVSMEANLHDRGLRLDTSGYIAVGNNNVPCVKFSMNHEESSTSKLSSRSSSSPFSFSMLRNRLKT